MQCFSSKLYIYNIIYMYIIYIYLFIYVFSNNLFTYLFTKGSVQVRYKQMTIHPRTNRTSLED